MLLHRGSLAVVACAGALASVCGSASGTIAFGTYSLHNHPDGNARPPYYGPGSMSCSM